MAHENQIERIIRNALYEAAQTEPLPPDSKPTAYDNLAVDIMVALRDKGFDIVKRNDA